jgi:hypothetical protein
MTVPSSARELNRPAFHVVLFATFALLFFARSFTNYFVSDDYQFLGRINFAGARSYLGQSWGYGNEYRPLLAYSYALDALISGTNPIGYHVTNTIIHTAAAILVGCLALACGAAQPVAAIASLIFLLNPVSHESVLWISGRPVVLGCFFVLAACYFFVRAAKAPRTAVPEWIAAYTAFVLALGTYEVGVITAFLAALCCGIAAPDRGKWRIHLFIFLGLTAIYIVLWNWFFNFRITRFPIETSPWNAVRSFVQAVLNAFHGSLRPEIAVIYVGLLAVLIKKNRGGALAVLISIVWFFLAYLPFFIVHGYADRFAYLSSVAAAALLALALGEVIKRSRRLGLATLVLVLAYLATGMQNRITTWKEAGQIARMIPYEIKTFLPVFPEDRLLVLLNVPLFHKQASVYITGMDRALQREYPDAHIKFSTQLRPWAGADSIILEYSNGHMIRREFKDVRDRYN